MKSVVCFSTVLAVLLSASFATAGVPQMINYQGYLTDGSGDPFDTTVSITFTIYDDSTGGLAKWAEVHPSVTVADGLFSVILGSTMPIDDSVFVETARWLGVQVEADPEISPRTQLITVPYAYRVSTVDGSTGGIISGDVDIQSDLNVAGTVRMLGFEMATGASDGYILTSDGSGVGTWQPVSGTTDNDWTYQVTDTDDTTLMMGGQWGLARYGNVLFGNLDRTHVNFGVTCTTGTDGSNIAYCAIGGGAYNKASGEYATISGGVKNIAGGFRAVVGGGGFNTAGHQYATVAGGDANTASQIRTTVSGGYQNSAVTYGATVGGGSENMASGYASTICGGYYDTASGENAVVGGGMNNIASGYSATVPGGRGNRAEANGSFACGRDVTITSDASFTFAFGRAFTTSTPDAAIFHNTSTPIKVGIGIPSPSEMLDVAGTAQITGFKMPTGATDSYVLTSDGSGVGTWQAAAADNDWIYQVTDTDDTTLMTGGNWGIARNGNVNYGNNGRTHVNLGVDCSTGTSGQNYGYCTVGGGYLNKAGGNRATVAGGIGNVATGDYSVVAGGNENASSGIWSTVGGGQEDTASGTHTTVGGGKWNKAGGEYATVAGGLGGIASGRRSAVGGGYYNTASHDWTTVSGGYHNTASHIQSTVSGGTYNTADHTKSTVSGGYYNYAGGDGATVGGGEADSASGVHATIAGGYMNRATRQYSAIPGGYNNTNSGKSSLAAGESVTINQNADYTFAFGRNFATSAANAVIFHNTQSPMRVGIGTTNPQGALDVNSTAGALIVPRMTQAQRNAFAPVNGMIIYNTDTNKFNFYENGAWKNRNDP